jgi:hypothetical protein
VIRKISRKGAIERERKGMNHIDTDIFLTFHRHHDK